MFYGSQTFIIHHKTHSYENRKENKKKRTHIRTEAYKYKRPMLEGNVLDKDWAAQQQMMKNKIQYPCECVYVCVFVCNLAIRIVSIICVCCILLERER